MGIWNRNRFFRFGFAGLIAIATLTMTASAWTQETRQADFNVLKSQAEQALLRKDYAKALEIMQRMNDIGEPQHYETLYSIARIYALLDNRPKAYEWLDRAVDAGFWDAQSLKNEEAFKGMREEKRFRDLVRGAWAKGYIAMLERPERAVFQKPDEVMKAFELRPGLRVADIGAGSGYFTIPVAKAVGTTGTVLAIDISPEMICYLDKRVQAEQLSNVKLVKVEKDDPQLPAAGIDLILMVDTIHYIQNRGEYARKLRTGLAPGGRVVVIDYIPKPWAERPWGPTPEQQVSREQIDADMAKAGLKPIRVYNFLTEQYFVVYGIQ
jgi:ubiquinone/menaquinone biosynthesis C-methylase UbiE